MNRRYIKTKIKRDTKRELFRQGLFFICLIFLLVLSQTLKAQERSDLLARFTVHAGSYERINTPVSVSLAEMPLELQSGDLQLFEMVKGQEKPVPCQLDGNYDGTLRWILTGKTEPGATRNFVLKKITNGTGPETAHSEVDVNDDGKSLTVNVGGQHVLSYRYAKKSAPEGVSDAYARSGYIHPLWSPEGEVLTRIQPSDHYHHYGIWNPWTHTEFEGREIDFWNLIKKQGTVRSEGFTSKISGDVFGGFEAVHDHVDLKASTSSGEKIALKEKWNVKVWNTDLEHKKWLIDFSSTLNPASESPLTIKAYRYQGFGFRATPKWNDKTAAILTSEGKNKTNGNSTHARWAEVHGTSGSNPSGILFMTYPENHNYPERLRIWPTGMNNGKENVFFNFNPAQKEDWVLKPGHTYTLRYRMMVYDGELQPEEAERYWNDFAHPPKIDVTRPKLLGGKKILLYTKNGKGYVHKNIPASIAAIKKLGEEYGFEVHATTDPAEFTTENLRQYDVLVFSNTNNEIFDTEQQKQALQQYIRSGGGFVGIHSASGSERNWPWFWKMLGGKFYRHAPFQEFVVDVVDSSHVSTSFLPTHWDREDEVYYLKQLNPDIHVLLASDLNSVEDTKKDEYPGVSFGENYPLAWYHEFDGGREWYTALGHSSEVYSDPVFLKHILGGIRWASAKE